MIYMFFFDINGIKKVKKYMSENADGWFDWFPLIMELYDGLIIIRSIFYIIVL